MYFDVVVSYYDLSVVFMSVMGFKKKEVWIMSKIVLGFWNLLTLHSTGDI